LHPLFDAGRLDSDDIEKNIDRYVDLTEAGRTKAKGWPGWINIPSKIAQMATAAHCSASITKTHPGESILINAVDPGLIRNNKNRIFCENYGQIIGRLSAGQWPISGEVFHKAGEQMKTFSLSCLIIFHPIPCILDSEKNIATKTFM